MSSNSDNGTIGRLDALEWCDHNMHVNYPLHEAANCLAADGVTYLPTSFLVDLRIVVPTTSISELAERFFISAVIRQGNYFKLQLSVELADSSFLCAESAAIDVSLTRGSQQSERTIALYPLQTVVEAGYPELAALAGDVVIGTCIDMVNLGSLQFSYAATRIEPLKVFVLDSGLDHITVIGTDGIPYTLTGNFTLSAGDGVDFSVAFDNAGYATVTVTRVATEEESSSQYNSVEDVVLAVENRLGRPINSINGVTPDSTGNLELRGGDCVNVTGASSGLLVSNPCSKPCCGQDSLPDITQALNNLELARERLEKYYDTLTTNINTVQSRLASLISISRT